MARLLWALLGKRRYADCLSSGDDADARASVAELIDSFGFDPVEVSPLSEGWRIQRDTPGYVTHETAESLREALARAKRYHDQLQVRPVLEGLRAGCRAVDEVLLVSGRPAVGARTTPIGAAAAKPWPPASSSGSAQTRAAKPSL